MDTGMDTEHTGKETPTSSTSNEVSLVPKETFQHRFDVITRALADNAEGTKTIIEKFTSIIIAYSNLSAEKEKSAALAVALQPLYINIATVRQNIMMFALNSIELATVAKANLALAAQFASEGHPAVGAPLLKELVVVTGAQLVKLKVLEDSSNELTKQLGAVHCQALQLKNAAGNRMSHYELYKTRLKTITETLGTGVTVFKVLPANLFGVTAAVLASLAPLARLLVEEQGTTALHNHLSQLVADLLVVIQDSTEMNGRLQETKDTLERCADVTQMYHDCALGDEARHELLQLYHTRAEVKFDEVKTLAASLTLLVMK